MFVVVNSYVRQYKTFACNLKYVTKPTEKVLIYYFITYITITNNARVITILSFNNAFGA